MFFNTLSIFRRAKIVPWCFAETFLLTNFHIALMDSYLVKSIVYLPYPANTYRNR